MNKIFSVKSAILKSAKVSVISTIVRQVFQIVIMIALARYLVPEEFARAGIAISISAFFLILAQAGLAQAIIISKRHDKRYLDAINGFLIILGILCYVIIYTFAPTLDKIYDPIILSDIVRVGSISIIMVMIGTVPQALLQKRLDFTGLSTIIIITSLVQLFFTLYFIELKLGIWTIVVPPIISNFIASILYSIRSDYRPWIAIDIPAIRDNFNYSSSTFMAQILNFLSSNSILFSMGRLWSPSVLGHYFFVDSKVLKPYELITLSLFSNLFPILTRISDNILNLGEVFIKINRVAAYVIMPIYIYIILIIPDFVPLVFGPVWESSIKVFQIMLLVGIVRSIGFGANSIFYVLKIPNRIWYIHLIRLVGYLIVIFFAYRFNFDIISVANGVVVTEAFVGLSNLVFALRSLGIRLNSYFSKVWRDVIFLLAYTSCLVQLFDLNAVYIINPVIKCGLLFLISIFLYLLLLFIFHRSFLINQYLYFRIKLNSN